MQTASKICTSCEKTLPLDSFYLRKSGVHAGTYSAQCKDCVKAERALYRQHNADKVKESNRKSYLKHQKQRQADGRAYYWSDPASKLEKSKEYRALNKDALAKKRSEYYREHRQEILAKNKIYKSLHASRYKESKREYARKTYYDLVPYTSNYTDNLKPYESVRCNSDGLLEVKCAYCGKWHTVTRGSVKSRLDSINGYCSVGSEHRLYCSDACKHACPVFWAKTCWTSEPSTRSNSREVQPQLRQMVLERDDYTCQKCGAGVDAELHCHHIDPVVNNPIESADIENCITVCKQCHKELHRIPGCSTGELRCSTAVGF